MTILDGLTAAHDWLKPMIAPAAGIAAGVAAIAAAAWGKWSQAKKPEQALSEIASVSPRATAVRLHADDRGVLEDLREAIADLTRSIRQTSKAITTHAERVEEHGEHVEDLKDDGRHPTVR